VGVAVAALGSFDGKLTMIAQVGAGGSWQLQAETFCSDWHCQTSGATQSTLGQIVRPVAGSMTQALVAAAGIENAMVVAMRDNAKAFGIMMGQFPCLIFVVPAPRN
jgi:hypothetical protein